MLNHSQRKPKLDGAINSSFLALIPKEASLPSFDSFRPIFLCNISYKILTKIIASRLNGILDALISPNQGGFVQNMNILDNIILVQEVVHLRIMRHEKCMVIKLDFVNDFDIVKN